MNKSFPLGKALPCEAPGSTGLHDVLTPLHGAEGRSFLPALPLPTAGCKVAL